MHQSPRVINVFSLVMINVIAVDSLRSLPISAKLGLPIVFYYIISALFFFIPVALVAAELATAYPQTGGLYIWVREAFGRKLAFITIWLQWVYNVVWYPTIMAFISTALAHLIAPQLTENKMFLLPAMLSLFWLFTFINCFGMRISSIISILSAVIGTILPMLFIIGLSVNWVFNGNPIAVPEPYHWFPDMSNLGNVSLFSAVLFGLIGMEMSAVHAEEVHNPQRDYPRALLISTLIIISTLTLGSLAIVIVVPNEKLNLVSGLMDAFDVFFNYHHVPWMTSVLASLIILGSLGAVSAWIIGPPKGLLVAARDGSIPHWFSRVNKHGTPTAILLTQAVIFSILSSLFILLDSINEAYWLLSDLSALMALMVYLFMFAAAIKLRYSQPERVREFRIPGPNIVMWLVAGIGALSCSVAIMVGFIPPSQIPVSNVIFLEAFLVGGLFLFVFLPWVFAKDD